MAELNKEQINKVLAGVKDAYTGQDLVAEKAVKQIDIDGEAVRVSLSLGYPCNGYRNTLAAEVKTALAAAGVEQATVEVGFQITSHEVQQGVKVLPGVKNTIAVASGKGGVGKSTTATNLALALQVEGAKVGVLDADIYGPSQPRMLGCGGQPESPDGKSIEPNVSYNIQSMSIGYLIDEETPMIWRGPMVTSALEQLLNDTNWRDLDYLVIDLPPGTGDIQLTLSQKVPLTGAVIITTPQDIALLDARKGLKMFEKVNVPVLGIVENMSTHICSNCGHEEPIFGSGGGAMMARQYGVDLLGQLPLDISIREGVDNGKPSVAVDPDSRVSAEYREIARRTAARIALRAKDYSAKFPKIVIQNT